MTLAEIRQRVYDRLGDNGTYYLPTEIDCKVNEGQRLFVLLTLCLEKTSTLSLTAATAYYHLLQDSGFTDFLVPLRVRVTGGARLNPNRLDELAALDENWETQAGTPERYGLLGLDLLALNKQPAGGGTSLDITFAHGPAVLSAASDVPAIPPEYHLELVDYAIHGARFKEGGQELLDTVPMFERFLEAAMKMNGFVRARSLGKRYDRLPAELIKRDLSRLLKPIAPNPAARKALLEITHG